MLWPKAGRHRILHQARPLLLPRSRTFTVAGWAYRAVDMIVVRMEGTHMASTEGSVMNEAGAVSVDGPLAANLVEEIREISGGCVCCDARDEIAWRLKEFSRRLPG